MEEKERITSILHEATGILSDHLNPDNISHILDSLEIADVLTDDDVSVITQPTQKADRVGRMLGMIKQKDVRAYKKFMKALSKERKDLYEEVEVIRRNYTPCTERPSKRPRLTTPQADDQPLTTQNQRKTIIPGCLPGPGSDHRDRTISQVISDLREIQLQPQQHHDAKRRLEENCRQHGLTFHGNTPADGNCFFHAVSDQLSLLGLPHQSPAQLRRSIVDFLKSHPNIQGQDGTIEFSATQPDWDAYLESMSRDGEWADAIILVAIAHMLKHDILVVTSSPQGTPDHAYQWIVGDGDFKGEPLKLGHEYELHYRSLVSTGTISPQNLSVQAIPSSENTCWSHRPEQPQQNSPDFPQQQLNRPAFHNIQTRFHRGDLIGGTVIVNPNIVYGDQHQIDNQYNVGGNLNIYNISPPQNFDHNDIDDEVECWSCTLKNNYCKRRSKIRFGSFRKSIVDTDDLFVDLQLLQDGNKYTEQNTKKIKSYLDLLSIRKEGTECNHVLLRGVAGSGKSTLINRIAYKWAVSCGQSGTKHLSKFSLLFVLDVRKFSAGETVQRAVHSQLLPSPTTSPEEISEVIDRLGERCLFLIDGYDEMSSECLQHPTQVLDSPVLVNCWVIVTTRPHMVDSFCHNYSHGDEYAHVELSGFSKESVDNYVRKFFQIQKADNSGKLSSSLLRRIQNVPILDSLSSFPILLVMICHLWLDKQNEPDLPESITELYKEAIIYLNKHWQRNFSEDIDSVLKELGHVAIEFLFKDQLSFGAELLKGACLESACKIGLIYQEDMGRNKTCVTFIHKTFQEFCSAVYLASLANVDTKYTRSKFQSYLQNIGDVKNIQKMEYILWFCCGLSSKAAFVILPHVVNILDKEHKQYIGNEESLLYEIDDNDDIEYNSQNNLRWELPLKLFYETESLIKSLNGDVAVLETAISQNCETGKEIIISRNIFYPYPFNIDILMRFLRCMPLLEKLILKDYDSCDAVHRDSSVVCSSLKELLIVGRNDPLEWSINSLFKLLGRVPTLERLQLGNVKVTGNLDEQEKTRKYSQNEHISVMCTTLKIFEIISKHSVTMNSHIISTMLERMPSLEQLKISDYVNIRRNIDENKQVMCESLKKLEINLMFAETYTSIDENLLLSILRNSQVLEELTLAVKINSDLITGQLGEFKFLKEFWGASPLRMDSVVKLLGIMPILEKLMLYGIKEIGKVDAESLGMCTSLKELRIESFGFYRYEIDVNVLIQYLLRMSSLEKLTLCNIEITGDLDKNVSVTCNALEELNLVSYHSMEGNTIVMLEKLRSRMPSLKIVTFSKSEMLEKVNIDLSVLYRSFNEITFRRCYMSENTFVVFLNRVSFLKKLTFTSVSLREKLSTERSVLCDSIQEWSLSNGDISGNTLVRLLRCMPSLVTLTFLDLKLTVELDPHVLLPSYRSLKEFNLGYGKITSSTLKRLLGSMPTLQHLELVEVEVTGDSQAISYTVSSSLCELIIRYTVISENTILLLKDLLNSVSSVDKLILGYIGKVKLMTADISGSILLSLLGFLTSVNTLQLCNIGIAGYLNAKILAFKTRIKELIIINKSFNQVDIRRIIIRTANIVTCTMLKRLLVTFPSLTKLTLDNVCIIEDLDADISLVNISLNTSLIQLRHLKVYNKTLGGTTLNILLPLLVFLPSLETLTLHNIEHTDDIDSDIKGQNESLRELNLEYDNINKCKLTTLLKLLACVPSLQELTICKVDIVHVGDLSVYSLCKSLRVFSMTDVDINGEIMDDLLSHMKSLETLSLHHVVIKGELDGNLKMESLRELKILSNHTINSCTTLKTLLMCMPTLETMAFDLVDITVELNACVTQLCSSIKTLTIMYNLPYDCRKCGYEWDVYDNDELSYTAETILGFLRRMPLLEKATLAFDNFDDINWEMGADLTVQCKSLKEFHIYQSEQHRYRGITLKPLMTLLRCMPNVEKLVLHGLNFKQFFEANVSVTSKSLVQLEMKYVKISNKVLLKLLFSIPLLSKVTLVDVDRDSQGVDDDVSSLFEKLKRCGDISPNMRKEIRDLALRKL